MSRRQPLVALRALRVLLADPQRTEQVFVMTSALAGDSIPRGYARFARTPLGKSVVAEGRELLTTLTDRAALAHMPDGSVGRAYLRFVEANGIDAEGLVEASESEARPEFAQLTPEQALYARRLRDQHDLWHVVTGYSTQPFGEVCVVAFTYAQTRNLGLGVIAAIGAIKIAREGGGRAVLRAAWQGWRNGRRAAWLPAVDWEAMLARPLDAVRSELGLRPPTRFQAITDYRADWATA